MPCEWGDEEPRRITPAMVRKQDFWMRLLNKGVRWGRITSPPIKGSTIEEIALKLIVETGGRTW